MKIMGSDGRVYSGRVLSAKEVLGFEGDNKLAKALSNLIKKKLVTAVLCNDGVVRYQYGQGERALDHQ